MADRQTTKFNSLPNFLALSIWYADEGEGACHGFLMNFLNNNNDTILYPGLPMFFNVTHEKSGGPGRFYDVMMTHWTQFGPWLVISAHAMFYTYYICTYVEQLCASQYSHSAVKGTAVRCTSHGVQVEKDWTTEWLLRESRIDAAQRKVARFTIIVSSSVLVEASWPFLKPTMRPAAVPSCLTVWPIIQVNDSANDCRTAAIGHC